MPIPPATQMVLVLLSNAGISEMRPAVVWTCVQIFSKESDRFSGAAATGIASSMVNSTYLIILRPLSSLGWIAAGPTL